jgi:DNA-binding response OmpR family regulator
MSPKLNSPKLHSQIVSISEVPVEKAEPRRSIILVVDDEKVIADTLTIILSMSGFAVLTSYDGTEALVLAQLIPPDLLLSDVVMPGMTGVELAIAVVDMAPDCKVLLFSGQAATADLLAEARAMGRDFTTLTKPVHPTDMLRRIHECLKFENAAAQHAAGWSTGTMHTEIDVGG